MSAVFRASVGGAVRHVRIVLVRTVVLVVGACVAATLPAEFAWMEEP